MLVRVQVCVDQDLCLSNLVLWTCVSFPSCSDFERLLYNCIFPHSVFFSCAIESDRKEAVWLRPTCRVWLWPVESSLVFGQFKSSWPQTWPRSEAPQFRTLYTLSFSSRSLEFLLICKCFVWFFLEVVSFDTSIGLLCFSWHWPNLLEPPVNPSKFQCSVQ